MKRFLIAKTIAYIALAILIPTLGGCAKSENTGTTGDARQPVSPGASPMDSLAKSMRAQLAAKSFRVRISSSNATAPGEFVVEFVAPDRLHMTNPISELISVGSETYTRQNGGPWMKAPTSASDMIGRIRDPKLIEELDKNYTVTLIGPDTLDGVPVVVYEYTPKSTTAQNLARKTKVWIGADDSLPRKTEVESEVGGQKSITTIIYSDYDSDIKINLPV
jgi:outer membrane lipoprotein-sorting protein